MKKEQFERLRASRFMKNLEEVNVFRSTLLEIQQQGDVSEAEAKGLYRLFEDSSDQQDVLWGLLHLIEDLNQEIWLPAFVAALPEMVAKSPEWADTITARILNGEMSRPVFRALLQSAPQSRKAILPILEELSCEMNSRLQMLRQSAKALLDHLLRLP